MQAFAGGAPIAFDGAARDIEGRGDLIDVEAAEEAHLDDAEEPMLTIGEAREGVTDDDGVSGLGRRQTFGI